MISIEILSASSESDYSAAQRLFREYAEQLDFSLCFQDFDKELAQLQQIYGSPDGVLLLAVVEKDPVGCVGLRRLSEDICEMKRLYIQPAARRIGLGRMLVEALITEAKKRGYRAMRLDTIGATMKAAVDLYVKLGFREIPPYRHNPIGGALYMELDLTGL